MSELSGSCLCGAVKYKANAEPVMVAACHCADCQKQTGTAYSVIVGVPADSVTVEGDALKTYQHTGTSGMPVLRKFCGECGSPILADVTAAEGLPFLKGGTLDNKSSPEVGAEIWCDSKSHWAYLDESVPKMPGNPPLG